jgi:hypothetical protein
MNDKASHFLPADRVRFTMDTGAFCDDRPDQTFLDGTRGSIGVIVSFEEFQADYLKCLSLDVKALPDEKAAYLAGIQKAITDQFLFPIRFETVQPSEDSSAVVCCRVGEIRLIHQFYYGLTGAVPIIEKI